MRLIYLSTAEVSPNPWNTNHVSPELMDKLCVSLREKGWVKPILVRPLDEGRYQILGGQHRFEAAERVGMLPAPAIDLGPMDDKQAKEVGLIDNARYGEDDALGLAELLADLGGVEDLGRYLPFMENELAAFSARDIDLETLGLDEETTEKAPREKKIPRTHTVQRYKVPVEDADMIGDYVRQVQAAQGFVNDDSLTNAGDALVWIVRRAMEASDE